MFTNGGRSITVLRALLEQGFEITDVFVPRDSIASQISAGTGINELTFTVVSDPNERSFVEYVSSKNCELGIVAGYSDIFCAELIETPRFGMLNLHGGRLPEYRGGSPLNWQLVNGEICAGISVIQMDSGIDTGRLMSCAEISISDEDTIATIHERANEAFPGLVLDAIKMALSGDRGQAQDESRAGYWHQRNDDDGKIEWTHMTAQNVVNLVRGVTRPYPGAHTTWRGKEVRIFHVRYTKTPMYGVPGRVVYLQGEGPYVVCRDRAVLIEDYLIDGVVARLPHGARLGLGRDT